MADEQTSQKIELSEVMMAMDVVDTIRHQRSLVQRELESGDREAELIEKLKKIYADQGLEVSEQVIADGVKAMREERFAYQPPSGGLNIALAKIYVNRGRWAKLAIACVVAVLALWAGYRYLYAIPAEKDRNRLAQEFKTEAAGQQTLVTGLQDQISAAGSDLQKALQSVADELKAPARKLADQARQHLDSAARQVQAAAEQGPVTVPDAVALQAQGQQVQQQLAQRRAYLDQAQNDLQAAQAAIGSIGSLGTKLSDLDALRAEALSAAREPAATDKIDALYNSALSAIQSGDLQTAQKALQALVATRDLLAQTYSLQIVSRPGTPSGVWRYPDDQRTARNYYLIVEAILPSGQRLKLPITSEEDGTVRTLDHWGLRVPEPVYEQVRQDKEQDGIVDRKEVGVKERGYLNPRYTVQTTGKTITAW
jgi:hypothetical protein